MGDKHIVGVSEAIAPWQGTVWQLLLTRLPGKSQSIDGGLLLSLGSKGTAPSTAMGCIFARCMALPITPNYWTPNRDKTGVRLQHCGYSTLQSWWTHVVLNPLIMCSTHKIWIYELCQSTRQPIFIEVNLIKEAKMQYSCFLVEQK